LRELQLGCGLLQGGAQLVVGQPDQGGPGLDGLPLAEEDRGDAPGSLAFQFDRLGWQQGAEALGIGAQLLGSGHDGCQGHRAVSPCAAAALARPTCSGASRVGALRTVPLAGKEEHRAGDEGEQGAVGDESLRSGHEDKYRE